MKLETKVNLGDPSIVFVAVATVVLLGIFTPPLLGMWQIRLLETPTLSGGIVEFALLVIFGIMVGAYGTLIGAGGGFIMVPVMLLVLGMTPQRAVGTSLTVVFLNGLSGTLSYLKQRRVDVGTGWQFALATVPGAVLGAYLSVFFTARLFQVIFGLLLVGLSLFLVWRPGDAAGEARPKLSGRFDVYRVLVDAHGITYAYSYNRVYGLLLSFVVGFLSSIFGIGGGVIHVPAMVHLFGIPAHVASATSHFILAISSSVGAATHIALGHVDFWMAAPLGLGVIFGAQIGAALSRRLRGSLIVRLLSLALTLVGLRLLFL
jgi:uncharacterized membrane protein YfcA